MQILTTLGLKIVNLEKYVGDRFVLEVIHGVSPGINYPILKMLISKSHFSYNYHP